ncbi:hypothetical protein BYT27DRAFT_7242576 [Phlegmacium glaucopus]|nr:hypothetical protein BYT27DRAFT_7242576 [Phlegmacium glaucopus]
MHCTAIKWHFAPVNQGLRKMMVLEVSEPFFTQLLKVIIMSLGVLRNLGKWASGNTKKTRFSQCSRQFTDAYKRGLTRKEAAWENSKYRGRRWMPAALVKDVGGAGLW